MEPSYRQKIVDERGIVIFLLVLEQQADRFEDEDQDEDDFGCAKGATFFELCESPEAKKCRIRETLEHLDRAGLSALFNTSEGNGKRQMRICCLRRQGTRPSPPPLYSTSPARCSTL